MNEKKKRLVEAVLELVVAKGLRKEKRRNLKAAKSAKLNSEKTIALELAAVEKTVQHLKERVAFLAKKLLAERAKKSTTLNGKSAHTAAQ